MNDNEFHKLLTGKLLAAQEAIGMSHQQLADRLHLTYRQVRRYYSNDAVLTIDTLLQLEKILGITLFNLTGAPPLNHATMLLTKDSVEFTTKILTFLLKNGITEHEKIEEFFQIIMSGFHPAPPLEVREKVRETEEVESKYKALRLSKGLSLRAVGESIGIGHSVIGRFERTGKDSKGVRQRLDNFYGE